MLVESFFTEDEIANIHNYPEENISLYINRALDAYRSSNDSEFDSIVLLQTYLLVSELLEEGLFGEKLNIIQLDLDHEISSGEFKSKICDYLNNVLLIFESLSETHRKRKILEQLKKISSKKKSNYEFSQEEIDKIQEIINTLRLEISKSTILEEEHKFRLLKKLETMQSEIHKKMSDLDRIWGFIGTLGVVAGKFGNDIKPIIDRCRELAGIVYKSEANASQIPYEKIPENIISLSNNSQQ